MAHNGETLLLLVSPLPQAQGKLVDALQGWPQTYRVYWVSQPELAASRALSLTPDVILVDDAVGPAPERYVRQLTDCCPLSSVVALVERSRLDVVNRVVLAGARAVLPKPLQQAELHQTLNHLLNEPPGHRPTENEPVGRVVVVLGSRGGVGRTSVACNTAVALAQKTEGGVALVDADFSAPAVDVMLNVPARRTIADLFAQGSTIDAELVESMLQTHASGVRILVGSSTDHHGPKPTTEKMERLLVLLKQMSAWTVVDLGNPLDEVALSVTDLADVVLLVIPPEFAAVRHARIMLEEMRERGYKADKVWPIVMRASTPHGLPTHEIEERLAAIRHTIPDDPDLALASINRGVPVALRHSRSALGRAYHGLAGKLVQAYGPKGSSGKDGPAPEQRQEAPADTGDAQSTDVKRTASKA